MVYVAGTCMNAGKTVAATELVRGLARGGLRVAAAKLTGVSLMRDALSMLDAGAVAALTFNDVGIASTHAGVTVATAKGIFNRLAAAKPDVIVAELGDGILGEYGVQDILHDAELMRVGAAYVMAAPDPVACWGANRADAESVRAADHGHHRPRHRQRGGPGLHPDRARPAGAQRAAGCGWVALGGTGIDGELGRESGVRSQGSTLNCFRDSRLPTPDRRHSMKVAVIGGAGYVAGELLRLLLQHPEVTECVATSRSQAGRAIGEVHPALAGVTGARFAGSTAGETARGRDVVFLSLEHGESSKVAGEVFAAGPGLVIDLAADFRVQDLRLYQQHYGNHPAPDLVSRFRYGLADIAGSKLAGATAIAAPGCFATAAQLALYPLARAGLDVTPSLFAVTGSSGAGGRPKETTHHPTRAHNLFAYSVLGHRHEAEVLQSWREWVGRPDATARLMAHSGPFVRGIYLTLHAYLRGIRVAPVSLRDRRGNGFRDAYAGRPFVRVLDAPPELTHAVGTNYALIHATESADGREVQVSVAIDNLVKGAGGQAIQAMNLALGIRTECSGAHRTAQGRFHADHWQRRPPFSPSTPSSPSARSAVGAPG